MSQKFDFENLVELCQRTHEETQRSAARAVERSLVVRNYLFGWYIVEYEQHGADRAEYGKRLIARLSDRLKSSGIKGGSPTNLWKFRQFYHAYPEIPQTASVEFTEPTRDRQTISATPLRNLPAPLSGSLSIAQILQTLSAKLVKLGCSNPRL